MMQKRTNLAQFVDRFYVWCKTTKFCLNKSKYAKKRVKLIGGGYNGSASEFRSTVVPYWKKYGVRPKKYWYDLYCAKLDAYDPRFIPDTMWFGKILPYYNNLLFMRAYTDKGMLSRILPNVRQPYCVVKNIAGLFYNNDDQIITSEEAAALCKKENRLIFKPSVDSGTGRLIQFYEKDEMSEDVIDQYFDQYKAGFVVQRIVKQHPDLARIHAGSLNTIRVISFHFEGEVHILSAQLRMGAGDAKIDNVSAGGCACAIKPDGWLADESVTHKSEWSDHHPSGIKFRDIRVPCYDKVLAKIKELHPQLPYYNLIGWDFAIDEEGEPVLLEFNVTQGQNQIGGKEPSFGDLTERVLEDVFIRKSLKDKMN